MNAINQRAWRGTVMGLGFLLALCAARVQADPQVGDSGDYSNLERIIDNESVTQQPFYVGDEGANNFLLVTNAGDLLQTSGYLYIGRGSGADHNEMLVTGQDSSATNRYVYIGDAGSHNTLRIEDNAFFYTERIARIGGRSNANHNAVIVDNATWQNARVVVGQGSQEGANHTLLVITNGGVVNTINDGYGAGYAYVGWSHGNQSAVSNRAVVTGFGSTWVMTNYLSIGHNATAGYNSMLVENEGRVEVGDYMIVGNSGLHNTLEVTSDGEIDVGGLFMLGNSGGHNTVDIEDGGQVNVAGEMRIGYASGSDSNTLHVRNGTLDVGDVLLVGRDGSYNTMHVTEGGQVAVVSNIQVGAQSGSSHNELFVDGEGTHLSSEAGLRVGISSDHNRMELTGGATYSNLYPNVGQYGVTVWDQVGHGGDHNALVVRGTGTHWYAGNRFYIGFGGGQDNRVLLSEGARMDIASHFQILGNNEMTVSTNAVLDLGNAVYLHGGDGMSSILRVDSGGVLTNSGAVAFRLRDNSQLLLEGPETRGYWNQSITIGELVGNTNNLVAVRDGAELRVVSAVSIGSQDNTAGHKVEVDGEDSLLQIGGILYVGRRAGSTGNELLVSNEGRVQVDGDIHVGHSDGSTGNKLLVSNEGRVQVDGNIYVGYSDGSTGNELLISNGGRVTVTTNLLRLGDAPTAYSNRVVVSGQDSRLELLDTGARQRFGVSGSYNETLIEQGGTIDNQGERSIIGGAGQYNRFVVDGDNSAHYGHTLYMADGGQHNLLLVTNQGLFHIGSGIASIGYGSSSQSNLVLVTGEGSVFRSGTYRLSRAGSYNLTRVEDGGRLHSSSALIGAGLEDGGLSLTGAWNHAEVTGAGSVWTNTGNFTVGDYASHNTLVVTNAGRVHTDGTLSIGGHAGAHSNTVLVTHGGVLNAGSVSISPAGEYGNSMTLAAGGELYTGGLTVGANGMLRIRDAQSQAIVDTVTVGDGGTLELDGGTLEPTTSFVVETGGTLAGSGIINNLFGDAIVTIQGTLSPGFSAGTMEIYGDALFDSDAVVIMEIGGDTPGVEHDQVIVWSDLTYGGTLKLRLIEGLNPGDGFAYQLFDVSGDSLGGFASIDDSEATLDAGLFWSFDPDSGTVGVIPEAATTGTMLLGLALITALRRRRQF